MNKPMAFILTSAILGTVAWILERLHYRFFPENEKSWLTNLSLLVMGGAVAFFALFVFEISKNI